MQFGHIILIFVTLAGVGHVEGVIEGGTVGDGVADGLVEGVMEGGTVGVGDGITGTQYVVLF